MSLGVVETGGGAWLWLCRSLRTVLGWWLLEHLGAAAGRPWESSGAGDSLTLASVMSRRLEVEDRMS